MRKLLLASLFSFSALASAQMCPPSTVVYVNGDILTGVGLKASGPSAPERVQALAVAGESITFAGTNEGALHFCDNGYQKVVDLHGAFAMPGFNDAHTHMAMAGRQRLTLDLDHVASLAEMQAKIKAYAAGLPDGAWITGGGWDHTKWAAAVLPTRQDLDAVSGGHPLYLERTDGHIAVVNTAALRAAGLTAKTSLPKGSQIDLDAAGEPTGIVREAGALALVMKVIPKPDAVARRRALELAIQDALQHGVTSVQDFSDYEDFQVLQAMEREGKLPLRFSEWMPFDLPVETLKKYGASQPQTDLWLRTGMLKGFMDGSLGSRTAAMVAPYSDDPTNLGLPRYDQGKLNAMAEEREAAGFRLGFHAIGDRANRMALDAFAVSEASSLKDDEFYAGCLARMRAGKESSCAHGSQPDIRNRIEHAQVLLPEDFARFERLHVIASMQPSHLLTDMAWAGDRLGPERSKYAYAWRSMLDHHVTLAFGTDYPVESVSPFRGLYSAVTRMNEAGTQTFHPEQKLTIAEAVYAYTQASAFAERTEDRKGRLEVNELADFVVLDRDVMKATTREVLGTKVLMTVVGGVVRWDASAAKAVMPEMRGKVVDGD